MGGTKMTKLPELYACIYVKEFPVQALLRLRSDLHSQPCVVMEGEPPLQTVCSLNVRARVLGATRGMTRVEIETLPAMTVLQRSHNEEVSAATVLLETAGAFSPRIEDHSSDVAFICVLDIAGTEQLLGTPDRLGRNLFKRIRSIGITASIAMTTNVHASISLARSMSLRAPVMVVPREDESKALAPLPLSVLGLSADQAETFASWGIHTLGMLAALPEKELIARMGQAGKRLRQLALGTLPHFFQPVEPPFTLEERIELESPIELLEPLLFVMNTMLGQLILRASSRALALASVTITLTLEGGGSHTRTVRPALPSNDRQLWLKLLHLDLESHPPQASILGLILSAQPGSTSKTQLGLFSPQLPEPARLDVTLALLGGIVGEENVGKAVLVDTHQQRGFRVARFTVPSSEPVAAAAVSACTAMRALRPPESVNVMLRDGKPDGLLFRQRRYVVERAYGPWNASGDWWNSTLWGVDQWDLVTRSEDGQLLCGCLMRDLMRNRWRMVGLYD